DGRAIRLALTDSGRVLQRRVGLQHGSSVARAIAARLTPGELQQLETICLKLAREPALAGLPANDTNGTTHPWAPLRNRSSSSLLWSAPGPGIRPRPGC